MAFDCSYLKLLTFLFVVAKSGFEHRACRHHTYDAKRPPPRKPSSRHYYYYYCQGNLHLQKGKHRSAPFDRVLSRSRNPCLEMRGLLSVIQFMQPVFFLCSIFASCTVCSSDPRTHPCNVRIRTPRRVRAWLVTFSVYKCALLSACLSPAFNPASAISRCSQDSKPQKPV